MLAFMSDPHHSTVVQRLKQRGWGIIEIEAVAEDTTSLEQEAVLRCGMTSGFAETRLLPFESYVLEDQYNQFVSYFEYASTCNKAYAPDFASASAPLSSGSSFRSNAPAVTVVICCYNDAERTEHLQDGGFYEDIQMLAWLIRYHPA